MVENSTVYLVQTNRDARWSMRTLLEAAHFKVVEYSSAKKFLADCAKNAGCLIAELDMPGMDGLALHKEVCKRNLGLPVVITSANVDVAHAVRAMKAGVADFILLPFDDLTFVESVTRAMELGRRTCAEAAEVETAREILASLTPRQREVLGQIVAGKSTKTTAYELGISPRTIEVYRMQIKQKLNAKSISDLVRIVVMANRVAPSHAYSRRSVSPSCLARPAA